MGVAHGREAEHRVAGERAGAPLRGPWVESRMAEIAGEMCCYISGRAGRLSRQPVAAGARVVEAVFASGSRRAGGTSSPASLHRQTGQSGTRQASGGIGSRSLLRRRSSGVGTNSGSEVGSGSGTTAGRRCSWVLDMAMAPRPRLRANGRARSVETEQPGLLRDGEDRAGVEPLPQGLRGGRVETEPRPRWRGVCQSSDGALRSGRSQGESRQWSAVRFPHAVSFPRRGRCLSRRRDSCHPSHITLQRCPYPN